MTPSFVYLHLCGVAYAHLHTCKYMFFEYFEL